MPLTLSALQADPGNFPEQTEILLRSPQVLSSLLNICLSRNLLTPSLAAVQLIAHLTQAVPPHPKTIKESDKDYLKFSQPPASPRVKLKGSKTFAGLTGLFRAWRARTTLVREMLGRPFGTGAMTRSWAVLSGVIFPVWDSRLLC